MTIQDEILLLLTRIHRGQRDVTANLAELEVTLTKYFDFANTDNQ